MALPSRSAVAPCQHIERLPGDDDRNVGAGYAMAMTATGAVVGYSVSAAVLTTLLAVSVLGGSSGLFLQNVPGFFSFAVSSTVILAPLAFVASVVTWRLIPRSRQYAGAISGSLATILTYPLAAVTFFLLANGGGIAAADVTGGSIVESVVGVVGFAGFAFLSTCWLTLPLGVLAGTLYERSRSLDE